MNFCRRRNHHRSIPVVPVAVPAADGAGIDVDEDLS
jgi:hypothetical protein